MVAFTVCVCLLHALVVPSIVFLWLLLWILVANEGVAAVAAKYVVFHRDSYVCVYFVCNCCASVPGPACVLALIKPPTCMVIMGCDCDYV